MKEPEERQQLVTALRLGRTCHHAVAGDEVKCPDPIHKQNCCTWVQIQQRLECMGDTLALCRVSNP